MKKLVLLIFLSLLSLKKTQAQENFHFGVKGGVNLYHLNFENHNSNYRTSFHLGILAEIPLDGKFAVQPEFLYSSQGAYSETSSFEGPVFYDFKLDYLQVPLVIKLDLFRDLALEAGPFFNFLVKERITRLWAMIPEGERFTDLSRRFEFGGLLGLSYKMPGNIFISTRFTYGLTDTFKEDSFSTTSNHYGYQLGIGYIF